MDIVREIFERVTAIATKETFTETLAVDLERQIRRHWGGERVYIAKEGERGSRSGRDESILKEWKQGERVALIAKRHGLTERRVRQILNRFKNENANSTPQAEPAQNPNL